MNGNKPEPIIINRAVKYILVVGTDEQVQAIAAYSQGRLVLADPMPLYRRYLATLNRLDLPGWFWREYEYQDRANTIDEFETDLADAICIQWLRRQFLRAKKAGQV